MIELVKYIFYSWIIIRYSLRLSIYTSILVHYMHSICGEMDKVQSIDKVQSDMEVEKQKIKVEIPEKGHDIQQKEPRKRKRQAQEIGYPVKGYWIKEKKRVKVDGVEKEVTEIKDLVFSPDVSLLEDSDDFQDTWGFFKF